MNGTVRPTAARMASGCALLGLLVTASSAWASDGGMSVGDAVRAPPAFYQFCAHDPASCRPRGPAVASVALTPRRMADLEAVTRRVNHSIKETPDFAQFGREDVWSYPANGKGDCEDYVLEKRRELIAAGWPSSVLLITVVRDDKGDGHAVLTAVTDRGDVVLDSRSDAIRKWSETPYTFYTRQSSRDPLSFKTVTDINPSAVGPAAVAMRAAKFGVAAGTAAVGKGAGKGNGLALGVGNGNKGGNGNNGQSNAGGNGAGVNGNGGGNGNGSSDGNGANGNGNGNGQGNNASASNQGAAN